MPKADQETLRRALLALPHSADGRAFLERSRFQGVQTVDEAYMKRLDTYLPETRRHLAP